MESSAPVVVRVGLVNESIMPENFGNQCGIHFLGKTLVYLNNGLSYALWNPRLSRDCPYPGALPEMFAFLFAFVKQRLPKIR